MAFMLQSAVVANAEMLIFIRAFVLADRRAVFRRAVFRQPIIGRWLAFMLCGWSVYLQNAHLRYVFLGMKKRFLNGFFPQRVPAMYFLIFFDIF